MLHMWRICHMSAYYAIIREWSFNIAEATKQYFYKNWAKSSTSMKLGMMVPYSVLKNPRRGTHLNF